MLGSAKEDLGHALHTVGSVSIIRYGTLHGNGASNDNLDQEYFVMD